MRSPADILPIRSKNRIARRYILLPGVLLILFGTLPGCRTNQTLGAQFDDTAISTSIRTKFLQDSNIGTLQVKVATDEGEVYLIGRVETRAASLQAELYARDTEGVWSVINDIDVGAFNGDLSVPDDSIQKALEARILRDPDLPSLNIDVIVHEGKVFLIGRVRSERERSIAETLAGEMEGVRQVTNYLKAGQRLDPDNV
ncbi:MAG: BON domain-containing protein [Leptospiraceae bacterium]|nr:BON domain-containing protein [Leptospiraceae bacterium]